MKQKFLNFIKNILRKLGFVIIKSKDDFLIKKIKENFVHNERSFVYGLRKYLVDSVYCHASPGVIETIVLDLDNFLKNNPSKNKLLNLGGGTGQVSKIYEKIGFEVYNVDIEGDSTNKKHIKFDLNSVENLPLDNDFFDIVIASEIIEHIENPWKLFRDVRKHLKKDGKFVLTTPNIQSNFSRLKFLFSGFLHWFTPDCFSFHINPLFKWEIDLIAKKYNFRLEKICGSGDYYFRKNNHVLNKILAKNESLIFFFNK